MDILFLVFEPRRGSKVRGLRSASVVAEQTSPGRFATSRALWYSGCFRGLTAMTSMMKMKKKNAPEISGIAPPKEKSPFIRTDPACYRDRLPPGHAVDIRDGSYNRVKIPESGHCRGCGLRF